MRDAMMLAAMAITLVPAAAHAQATLSQDRATCSAYLPVTPTMTSEVQIYFNIRDGALARTGIVFTTRYRPETKTAGSSDLPIRSASIAGEASPAGGDPANLSHRLNFTSAMGRKVGVLTVRYIWNGAAIHETTPRMDVREARQRDMADVSLFSQLPYALLKGGRGRLDVVIVSSLKPEPMFQLTYQLQGFGVTDWQRSPAAQPDATGIRVGGLLPERCY